MVVEGNGRKPAWAIVTGGASGLGREIAKVLLKKGFNVIITCRNTKVGEQACFSISSELGRAQSGNLEFAQVDMGDLSTINTFAEQIASQQYYIALVINNAAVWAPTAGEKTRSGMDSSFGVNYVGPFLLTQKLLPTLCRQPRVSKIINIGCGDYAKCSAINMNFVRNQAKTLVSPGSLRVTIEWARGLARVNAKSKANPYVVVSFREKEYQTKVVKNSLNPSWNETFTYTDVDTIEGSVELTIMDKGPFGSDIEIGKASIPLAGLSATSPNSLDSSLAIEVPLDFSKHSDPQAAAKSNVQFEKDMAEQRESVIRDANAVVSEPCDGVEYTEDSTKFQVLKRINMFRTSPRVIVIDRRKKEVRNETVHQRIRKQFPFEQILNVRFVQGSDTKIRICFIPRDMKIKGHDVPGGQRPYDLDFRSRAQRDIFVDALSGFVLSTVIFAAGRYIYKVVKQLNAAERDIRLLIVDTDQRKIYLIDADVEELTERMLNEAFTATEKGAKGFYVNAVQTLAVPDPKNPLILSIAFQSGVKWQVEFVALDQRYQFEKIVRPFIPVPAQGRIRVSMMHTRALSAASGGRFAHVVPQRELIPAPRPNPAVPPAAHLVPWVDYKAAPPPPMPAWAEESWDTSAPGAPIGAALVGEAFWTPLESSRHSKLCLASFTVELARRLDAADERVRCHMVDPGLLQTPMRRKALGLPRTARRLAVWWARRYGQPPERAAQAIATMAEQVLYDDCNGLFVEVRRGAPVVLNPPKRDHENKLVPATGGAHPSPAARDKSAATRLWDTSVAMVGFSFEEPYKLMLEM